MGISCRESLRARPCGFGRNAVRDADGAATPVVVPGPEPTCCEAKSGVDAQTVQEPEFGKIQGGLLLIDLADANEMIENLGHADSRQAGIMAPKQPRDFSRRWFVPQVRDDRKAVENSQRCLARAASCARAARRAASAVGPR